MDLYIIFSVCKLLIKYPDLIVALISLTVVIALGICQVCQANRVEASERRLNDRDEKRYKDWNEWDTVLYHILISSGHWCFYSVILDYKTGAA